MLRALTGLWKDEDGPTTVEYALLLVLVSIVAIAAWSRLGSNVTVAANRAADNIAVPST
ncbi:Flp family type IVb pilin [bacterium]|nr:Flp family type IVb pilin [bacterium]